MERVSPHCPLVESGAELSQREAAVRLRLNRGMVPFADLDSSQARTDQVPSSPRPSIAVAGPTKLRVTAAEADHMPLYLRALFRLLSSWVHRGSFRRVLGECSLDSPTSRSCSF